MITLDTDIQYLKGVGPKRAKIFSKLGINNIGDLLTFFPSYYQDRTQITPISQIISKADKVCIFGRIGALYQKSLSMKLAVLDIELFDDSGKTYIRFFRKQNPYAKFDVFSSLKKSFVHNKYAYVYGDIAYDKRAPFFAAEDYEIVDNISDVPLTFNKIVPIYPSSEGLSQNILRSSTHVALVSCKDSYPDISEIIHSLNNVQIMTAGQALEKIHYPANLSQAEEARRSFAAQEFLVLETALALSRANIKKDNKPQNYEIKKNLLTPFKDNLGYSFTKAQKRVINEIFTDMMESHQMNRLLMGDVGSGKTVVALSAALLAVENGYQVAIIAPTEILAEQHFSNISQMLKGLEVKISLITSNSIKKKSIRDKELKAIEEGLINIIIGTHSIIEDRVKFKQLSLIVIDEQHKFGVMQKLAALNKAKMPDILMMTATPIPRALAMTVYGEMDISAIDELPPGRIPIETFCVPENVAYRKTIEEIKKGTQAYIIYPLIDESDKLELKSAMSESDKLSKTTFKDFKVGLLHGRMGRDEKNEIMKKFKDKDYDILISTTVMEVGIDIPNAAIMIIQNADRFGLSSLHQLRGRIGRGKAQSYCYLVSSAKSEAAKTRLKIMTSTNDGFKIAEADLQMRGPGEVIGLAQHGFPEFKAGNLLKDMDIIDLSKKLAAEIISNDANLQNPKYLQLKSLLESRFSQKLKLINVG
jgi:ATP-dependent DNA helicase RecG